MSLYRKHRPQQFIDLIGQDHIRQTLSNALAGGNFSHAYLFAGPKGSGKTTTARLLAKALNCQGRDLGQQSFEPCNKCSSCKEITEGHAMDMIEIDAASNRGIDEIRDLREKIRFAPTSTKYKIYIIDECHMLTKEAFNALLKTLEEPPKHAIFIMATTELHKVPPTILSRTQVFDFRKAKIPDILGLLKKTAEAENLKIEEEALMLISHLSYGAFRDALSMLDQISTLGQQEKITLKQVQEILGQSTEGVVWDFAQSIAIKDRKMALEIIEKVYFEGKDLENFIGSTVAIFRKAILIRSGIESEFEGDEAEKIQQVASLDLDYLVLVIEKLMAAAGKVKTSILGQLPLEMAVFELTKNEAHILKPKAETEIPIINKPVKQEIESPLVVEMKAPEVKEENTKVSSHSESPAGGEESLNPEILRPTTQDDKAVSFDKWPEVIKEVKAQNNTLAALLGGAVTKEVTPNQINLAVRFKFHADQICNKKNLAVIEASVLKVAGTAYKVDCLVDKDLEVIKPVEPEEAILNDAKEVFEVE